MLDFMTLIGGVVQIVITVMVAMKSDNSNNNNNNVSPEIDIRFGQR